MGTAIIIDGADFSAKNIGKVTIKRDVVAEIVDKYVAKSGSSAYRGAIRTLVKSLIDSGLWDKTVCLYPMLGTTLDAMSVNLASENEYPLHFLENATAETNKVYFSNTTEVSNPLSLRTWEIKDNASNNIGVVLRFSRSASEVNNGSNLFTFGSGGFTTALTGEVTPPIRCLYGCLLGSRLMPSNVSCAETKTYIYLNEATKCAFYADGEKVNEKGFTESVSNVAFNGVIGTNNAYTPTKSPGEAISANVNLASGEVSLIAYGNYTTSDVAQLNAIIDAFVSAVGK